MLDCAGKCVFCDSCMRKPNMNKRFIKFADLPPNPLDKEDLKNYMELGMNVCLLTEDHVKMVEDGKLSGIYKEAVRNIEKTGMDVWIRNMYNDSDYFVCDADKTGSNYGSMYQLSARNITTEFDEFPQVTGFYMADEAYMYTLPREVPISWMQKNPHLFASFDKIVKLVEWKNKYYPDQFWHMNHVPGQSWDHYLPKDGRIYDYEAFLTEYTETILKKLQGGGRSICIDNYPLIGEDYIEPDYLHDLLVASTVAKRYNDKAKEADKAIFGICLQTFHAHAILDDRHRDIVSAEEITFQMYVGMALGARLFEYFCYRSYDDSMIGIMDLEGQKRIYDLVKAANERIAGLEEILCEFDTKGTFVVPGELCTENTAAFILAKDLFLADEHISVSADYDTLVGCLERDGERGYMLVNYTDPKREHVDRIKVRIPGAKKLCVYLEDTKKIFSMDEAGVSIVLKPGDGVFILPIV